jgi:uncharacterized membrane protein YesL
MPALRVLWLALVSLYDETIALVVGNLLWLALNLPVFLLLAGLGLPFADSGNVAWLLVGLAWLLLIVPTPAGVALGALAREAAGPDVPTRAAFWDGLRARWRLGVACGAASLLVTLAIVFNIAFYATRTEGLLRLTTILWLYGLWFWFGMHVYLVPLLHHVQEPRLLDLYRRAALITLGQAVPTLFLVLMLLLVGALSIVFLPAYVLVAPAYVAVAQAHAFREVRRRLGDLSVTEADQEKRAW